MFMALITDKFIKVNELDTELFNKPRRSAVIFSAFHKILYG